MDVTVTVINPNCTSAEAEETVFTSDQFPIIIGRSANCNLTLKDKDKYISSKHAELSLTNSTLTLTDLSSNGTWLNKSESPLGKGNSVPVTESDVISIGEYRLSIRLTEETGNDFQFDSDPFAALNDLSSSEKQTEENRKELGTAGKSNTDPEPDPFRGLEENANSIPELLKPDDHLQRLREKGIGPNDWPPPNQSTTDDLISDARPDLSQNTPDNKKPSEDDGWPDWTGLIPEPSDAIPRSTTQTLKTEKSSNKDHGDTLDSLLLGAGLNPADFASIDRNELAHHIGGILNRSTKSMMLLLRSRDEIKSAMRTDVTLLAARNNSPLKFSVDVEDALKKLLTPSADNGFTESNKAIDKGLHDIKIHQLAMLEAMRSALRIALSHFNPEILERKTREANPVASTLPLAREAKLWEQFQMRYDQITRDAVDDFSDLFGRELKKAYEKSVKELKRSGP